MTNLQKATIKAVREFFEKEKPREKITLIRHVHPRCYVVARPADGCLVVAYPSADLEPHLRDIARTSGVSQTVHIFDKDLQVGDWCSTAYVVHADCGQPVAVKCVGG
jgi:hypothetical protein